MRIPLEWLREYVDYGRLSPKQVAEFFESAGTEVEGVFVHRFGDRVVVAEIMEIRPHPNAEKLQIAEVQAGRKRYSVVCGAPNIAVGQKAPLALPGAQIEGRTIERVEIRGAVSEGMLLSPRELGLADDHTGILMLEEGLRTGQRLEQALGLRGAVLEVAPAPNRPDKFGLVGLARELSATLQMRGRAGELRLPKVALREKGEKAGDRLTVTVKDEEACPQYLARVVEFDPTRPTPEWMARRLETAGVRPISLAVDVTNYVMLETGNPLHAFDADRIGDGTIVVRRARKGEGIRTLDGVHRSLSPEHLVIADKAQAMALAGIIGGAQAEVSSATSRVVLEAATFDRTAIRRGAQLLGLRTEASTRFEKGLPHSLAPQALDRAAALLADLGEGSVLQGVLGSRPPQGRSTRIRLTTDDVERIGGFPLRSGEVERTLRLLGLTVEKKGEALTIEVPDFRPDLRLPEDLAEEVLRLVGYDRIPSRVPVGGGEVAFDRQTPVRRTIQSALVALGGFEVTTYSFVSEQAVRSLGLDPAKHLRLKNPRGPEQALLRSELLSRHFETLAGGRASQDSFIFELATVFTPSRRPAAPKESRQLGLAASGDEALRRVRGALEVIAERLGLGLEIRQQEEAELPWHPGRYAEIVVDGRVIGVFGEIHPRVREVWRLRDRVAAAALDFAALAEAAEEVKREFAPLPRFPEVRRDLSFDVPEETPFSEVLEEAAKARHVISVGATSTVSRKVPDLKEGTKNVLLTIWIASSDKTLTKEEIDHIEESVRRAIKRRFKARFR